MDFAQFTECVGDAYRHLYDLVTLRSHPLTDWVVTDSSMPRRDKAWQLHQTLIELVEELYPGAHAPPLSPLWRRYRLMSLRYVEGSETQVVADELGISRRHFYRERDAAVEAIAEILWHRYGAHRVEGNVAAPVSTSTTFPAVESADPGEPSTPETRLELLRQETARISQIDGGTQPEEVIAGVIELLHSVACQRNVNLELARRAVAYPVAVDAGILRHLLVILTGNIVKHAEQCCILFEVSESAATVQIYAKVVPPEQAQVGKLSEDELSALRELASAGQVTLNIRPEVRGFPEFRLSLPMEHGRRILIVDDNADTLELFQRYLWPHRYQVYTAQSVAEAQELADQVRPHGIILDLMMPERDGWDLLQSLRNRPGTEVVPIVVCSILRQHDLALALGASAFLAKPFTQQDLLEILDAVLDCDR